VPIADWIAVAVFVVATLGGAGFAGVRALRAWRAFRSARRSTDAGLLEVSRGVAGAEGRLARAGESAAGLNRAQAELRRSLAALQLLRAAAGDARGALRVLPFLRR
jgi:hypothetical protein